MSMRRAIRFTVELIVLTLFMGMIIFGAPFACTAVKGNPECMSTERLPQ